MKTLADEERRYNAVSAQITQLSDEGANDRNPATAILRALLMAEMYEKNDTSCC